MAAANLRFPWAVFAADLMKLWGSPEELVGLHLAYRLAFTVQRRLRSEMGLGPPQEFGFEEKEGLWDAAVAEEKALAASRNM